MELTPENLALLADQPASESEQLTHRLQLRTVIAHISEYGADDSKSRYYLFNSLIHAFAKALDVDGKRARRDNLRKQALIFRELLREGHSQSDIIKHLERQDVLRADSARAKGIKRHLSARFSRSTFFNNKKIPEYTRLMHYLPGESAAFETGTRAWFAAGAAELVAQELLDELRATRAPFSHSLRWELFCLLEGYQHNGKRVSDVMIVAMDTALGLIDDDGLPAEVALGGVTKRREFMNFVRTVAAEKTHISLRNLLDNFDDEDAGNADEVAAASTQADWRRLPVFEVALQKFAASFASPDS